MSCTSVNFSGLFALMHPEDSWVAKWQCCANRQPGAYAKSVLGCLPTGMVRELKRRGVTYRSRDKSQP